MFPISIQSIKNFSLMILKFAQGDVWVNKKREGLYTGTSYYRKKLCSFFFFYKTLQITLWNFHPSCVLVFYNRPSYPQYLLRYLDYKAYNIIRYNKIHNKYCTIFPNTVLILTPQPSISYCLERQKVHDYFLLLLCKSPIWFTEKHIFKIIIKRHEYLPQILSLHLRYMSL